ncbi:MAG: sigma-E factor negative regulatory protein [Pseudomonadota bacterium]|nr:sigma-E factor negative regulatory protein [Pseudomonadota bacterium]
MNQAGMNNNISDSLSAGIDGELSKEQLRFLLRQLDHDVALQQTWSRYHMARDSLRRQLPPMASDGFASRVMSAIDQEQQPDRVTGKRNHWLRWSTGGAIAASVAAAALMIGQPAGDTGRVTANTAPTHQSRAVASTSAPLAAPTAPAAVPPWLSGNSAGMLSQQASATLGGPFGGSQSPLYAQRLSAYPSMPRYRTLDNKDGSYLLLLDPEQQSASGASHRAAGVAQ